MTAPRLRTSLSRHIPRTPADREHLDAMEAAVWHKRGGIIVYPEQERAAGNEWLALAVEARGRERFGVRKG